MKRFKEIYLRFRSRIITIFSVLMIGLALLNIYFVIEVKVTSNDECLWQPKKINEDCTAIIFQYVKVDGVSWEAGIRDGDQLLEIDGVPLTGTLQAQKILNTFKEDELAEYTIKRNGEIFKTKVRIKKLIQIGSLANNLLALFWMLIGFVVLMANPDGRVQKLFYAIGVMSVFSSTSTLFPDDLFIGEISDSPVVLYILSFFWVTGFSVTPSLIVAFFWNFPNQFKIIQKKWTKIVLYAVPVLLFIYLNTVLILVFVVGKAETIFFQSSLGLITIVVSLANIIAWISLIIQYRRIKDKEDRKPILIILLAYTLGILASVYTAQVAPAITDIFFNSPEFYTPIILVVLVPVSFAYSIFRYQLMDVSVVIKNTITYGAATLSVAAIYFLVIYILGQSISQAIGTEYQGIIAGVVFIIFAIVFQSTKDKFQDFLTAKFYPEQFAHQKVLIRFSNDITTVVGLENIFDMMKQTYVENLKIDRFGILMKQKSNQWKLVGNYGFETCNLSVSDSRLTKFIIEKSITSKIIYIEQKDFAEVFPGNENELIDRGIFTIIPMMVKYKVIGLLLFGLKHSGSQFAGKDLELLCASANQAAISIENARLYESETEKLKLDKELDLARKIQQGLLPKCIPEMRNLDICGEMIPAMQVGGDYYDLIPFADSKLFVVVGDVSGKGISASLYMTKLQTMIKLACKKDKSPRDILIEINRMIYSELERNTFITMTLALFDLEKNVLRFCRAGHLPVLSALDGTVNAYKTSGIGIGLEKGVIFEKSLVEERVELQSGQIFAFFTDGVTEAMNEKNELFGEERLSALLLEKSNLNSNEIMEEIWLSLNAFRGNAEVNDDMTMVVVKVR
ncbi:MAG: hypothetical protein Kow0098_09800 [Ignavibacteriaceae bacterium]